MKRQAGTGENHSPLVGGRGGRDLSTVEVIVPGDGASGKGCRGDGGNVEAGGGRVDGGTGGSRRGTLKIEHDQPRRLGGESIRPGDDPTLRGVLSLMFRSTRNVAEGHSGGEERSCHPYLGDVGRAISGSAEHARRAQSGPGEHGEI